MGSTKTVCLIDDDPFVRDALALGLSDAGFEILTPAVDDADIVAGLPENIDAIVTDLNMPSDGRAVITSARARWPDLAIIAISGAPVTDGRSTAELAASLGADATLIKPFRANKLAELLLAQIDARRSPKGP